MAPINWLSGFWKTKPIFDLTSLIVLFVNFVPETIISPSLGARSPTISLAKVDLPEPLCPMMEMYFPSSIEKETCLIIGSSLLYEKLRFLTAIF